MTFDPGMQPPSRPPEPDGRPVAPATPSFIPPGIALATTPAPRSRVSMGAIAFVAAIAVAAVGLGFAGGRVTAPQAATRAFGNGNGFGFGNGNGNVPGASAGTGGFGGGGLSGFGGTIAITGSVTAVANGSITIQQANGRSVTLTVPNTATYHAETGASATSVTVGSQVQVTVDRVGFRGPVASGAPAASPGTGNGAGPSLTVSDILVLAR